MANSINRAGYVLSGDFSGKNIYVNDDSSFIIVSNDVNGKIVLNGLFPTSYRILKTISASTVDSYEDVSSASQGADPTAVAKGLFWLGPVGGLLGVAASQSATYDIAIYFNDGQKSLIRILSATSYQQLKRILFKL